MNREIIDGVTTFWRPETSDPGSVSATLTFGCGIRDEDLDTLGVTYLLAALVLPPGAPGSDDDRDAIHACGNETSFTFTGPPAVVAGRLAALCEALADPPLDRQAAVLATINRPERDLDFPTHGHVLHHRFGSHGPGLGRWDSPWYETLTDHAIRGHAARFFVRGNAVLTLTGPPPAGLRLPLPDGPRAAHPTPPEVAAHGPQWFAAPGTDAQIAMRAGWETRWFSALGVLMARVERVVTARDPDRFVCLDVVEIDDERIEMMLWVEPPKPRDAAAIAAVLWAELRRLATEGASADEVATHAAHVRRGRAEPDGVDDAMERAAASVLFDHPPSYADGLDQVTASEVTDAAIQWTHTAVLVVPPGTRPDLPGTAEYRCPRTTVAPGGRSLRPPLLTRLLKPAARRERLVLNATGVSSVDSDGAVHTIRFTDVVVVEERGRGRVVHGRNGCAITVDPRRFRGVRRAVRAIDAAVPQCRRLKQYT